MAKMILLAGFVARMKVSFNVSPSLALMLERYYKAHAT
jgi:hypothetical protein